jgi:FtsP/CotA-like multicopper oxidase with cupredoxin domain
MKMQLSRRGFMAGLVPGITAFQASADAATPRVALAVQRRTINVFGRLAEVYGIVNAAGGQGIEMLLGERFSARVTNQLTEPTVLHWHGLTPPNPFDGVAMLTQAAIEPGQAYDYDFENLRAGTHWMHSHLGLQEQQLLAAPLIVRETAEPLFDEQDHVVMLHDFTFRPPAEILAELQAGGGAHAHHNMAMAPGTEMPGMANDIVYDAMLANERTLDDPEIVQAERGGAFRLRIINAAAASNMWIDLGALTGELIAVDGNAIVPLQGQVFPLAIAQRADIRLQLPKGPGAWPIRFRAEGSLLQSGVILRSGEGMVTKLAMNAEAPGAILDLKLEMKMRAVVQLRDEPVTRTETLLITGGGADYLWALNGKSGMHDVLFSVREDDRIEVVMHNLTGMAHPMHLHGHYFKVVGIGNRRINGAFRDTVLVPPDETVTIAFDADNPGTWAFHCHHLYHMNSGMMGAIAYARSA